MRPRPVTGRTSQLQCGMALIEALVAAAVLGIGLVGATQLTFKALALANENRQRTMAQQLAQEAMACLHANSHTPNCPADEDIWVQGVKYTRQARSTPRGSSQGRDLRVSVTWHHSGPQHSAHLADASTAPGVSSESRSTAAQASGTTATHHLEWHSSVSGLPGWLGVSSP